ncbi:MAG: hypothetical protein IPL81_02940 [Flavobacteriales bacterium]|nr:hypothetical protein [Flavobacteriales bacterium]
MSAGSGFDLNVAYTTNGEPLSATDFNVELSDVNGDFSAATVIGTTNSTFATGSIPCTIPAGTLPGTDYRIRVVTLSPFYAPVPVGIVVELSTEVASIGASGILVRVDNDAVLVDLGSTSLENPTYQLLDTRGARIASGQLNGQGIGRIPTDGAQGVMILRIMHSKGMVVQRVFVP